MNSATLDQASEYSFARLKGAGGDISSLPTPLQTVVIVTSAQGIIDNGGLEYFYESDFDHTPPYSFFVEAYRRIGAESAATCIEDSQRMFQIDQAHQHEKKRQQWLDTVRNNEDHEFVKLSRKICGDESVWKKLAEYVAMHQDAFHAV
jgi:hypothetical protein